MYMLPGVPSSKMNLYKDLRLLEFARTILPKYDIVCCQEVFYTLNGRKEKLKDLAAVLGFTYSARSPRPKLFCRHLTDGGILTLSRFPIIE